MLGHFVPGRNNVERFRDGMLFIQICQSYSQILYELAGSFWIKRPIFSYHRLSWHLQASLKWKKEKMCFSFEDGNFVQCFPIQFLCSFPSTVLEA